MIYEFPDSTVPIRQGDIFIGLPRIDLSLEQVLLVDEEGERTAKWEELVNQSLRKGRLNAVADEHFRERIGEFFRRYPYDEWYALDEQEMSEYKKEYPDTEAFPWQKITK